MTGKEARFHISGESFVAFIGIVGASWCLGKLTSPTIGWLAFWSLLFLGSWLSLTILEWHWKRPGAPSYSRKHD